MKNKVIDLRFNPDDFTPATQQEKNIICYQKPNTTFFKDGLNRLLKNKVATISLIVIILITLGSIFLPLF